MIKESYTTSEKGLHSVEVDEAWTWLTTQNTMNMRGHKGTKYNASK